MIVIAHASAGPAPSDGSTPPTWTWPPTSAPCPSAATGCPSDPTGYRVLVDLPERDLRGELHLTPASRPFVVNNQPVGEGRLSWLFVPRLQAHGWFHIDGRDHRLDGEVAYHDHNWGRFRWGDDFGWEWGSVLPASSEDPWSFVFMRMTDRRRLRALSQALYVWRHDEPAAMFRDAAVQVALGRPPRSLPGLHPADADGAGARRCVRRAGVHRHHRAQSG